MNCFFTLKNSLFAKIHYMVGKFLAMDGRVGVDVFRMILQTTQGRIILQGRGAAQAAFLLPTATTRSMEL